MTAIYLLLALSLPVAVGFLAAFIWAVRSGQYDDTQTPALRVLADDAPAGPAVAAAGQQSRSQARRRIESR